MATSRPSEYPLSFKLRWQLFFLWPRWPLQGGMARAPLARTLRPAGPRGVLRLLFCGDIMVKSHDRVPVLHAGVRRLLGTADLFLGVLEAPVSRDPPDPAVQYPRGLKMPLFKMPLAFLEALFGQSSLSRDRIVLSLAANHAGDQGAAGLATTCAVLADSGFATVGVYAADTPPHAVVDVGGLRLGIVAWTQWMNGDPFCDADPGVVRDYHVTGHDWPRIKRERGIDCLIGLPHWDFEMHTTPSAANRALAHRLLQAAGFSIICGSHPHIIQPVEVIGGGLVHYSLSNFTFTLTEVCRFANSWMTCLSALTEVLVDRSDGAVVGYRVHPIVERRSADGSEIVLLADHDGPDRARFDRMLAGVFDVTGES